MTDRRFKLLYLPEYPYRQKLRDAEEGQGPRLPYMYFVENAEKYGIDADVLSASFTGPFGIWIPAKIGGVLLAIRALFVLSRYDVVLTWYGPSTVVLAARILLRWKRPRIAVLAWRPFDTKSRGARHFLKRLRTKILFSMADKILVVSSLQKEQFKRELGLEEDRIEFIPYAIDCGFFHSVGSAGRCPGSDAAPVLLMTGNADRDDNMILKAIKNERVRLKRVTSVSSVAKHVRECVEREGADNVELLQCVPYVQMRSLLAESSLVVLPIETTDQPAGLTSLLEAMSMGRPIVTTKGLSTADYVEEGETAILLEPSDDAASWTRTILELLGNQNKLDQLGLSARRRAKERFNLPVVAKQIAKAMRDLSS